LLTVNYCPYRYYYILQRRDTKTRVIYCFRGN